VVARRPPEPLHQDPGHAREPARDRGLSAEGISVNVTLIFSLERHEAVIDAFLAGLERRAERGLPLDGIASVASFFVSRVDGICCVERRAVRG
jgi:transaldolase